MDQNKPTVSEVVEWLQNYIYGYSIERWIINMTPELYIYVSLYIDTYNSTNKFDKTDKSYKMLLFGTELISMNILTNFIYAATSYSIYTPTLLKAGLMRKFPKILSQEYIDNIRLYYPIIPNKIINIYHNYISHAAKQKTIYYTFEIRESLIAFLLICLRKYIPYEIVHMIFIHIGIDIYKATPKNTIILNNGVDFTNSIKKIDNIVNVNDNKGTFGFIKRLILMYSSP